MDQPAQMPPIPRPRTAQQVLAEQNSKMHGIHAPLAPPPVPVPAAVQPPASLPAIVKATIPASFPVGDDGAEAFFRDAGVVQTIAGDLIKFKEGHWVKASDGTPFDERNADYIAHVDTMLGGYIRFNDGAPPDRAMGLILDGFVPPARESLGDTDRTKWPIGLDGQPADPWQLTVYLALENSETNEMATFATSSKTGLRAVSNLVSHYKRMRRANPDELPIVKLASGGFQHKDSRIGFVPVPAFKVVGKTSRDGVPQAKTDLNDSLPEKL